jgi:uncharacterized repeat protein (TIGR01451 family)
MSSESHAQVVEESQITTPGIADPAAAIATFDALAAPPLGGANVLVSNSSSQQNETTIAINPTDTTNLVGGANDYRSGAGSGCGFYASFDRGQTWTNQALLPFVDADNDSVVDFTEAGDPAVAFDSGGNAYYLCMNFNRDGAGNGIQLTQYVFKSFDGGATWGPPVLALGTPQGTPIDKGHIALDIGGTSPFHGNVYVAGTNFGGPSDIIFNRSTDGGNSFDGCTTPPCFGQVLNDTSSGVQGANIAVADDGTVYVVWAQNFGGTDQRLMMDFSTDGGVNFGTDVQVHTFLSIGNPGGQGVRPLNRVNSFPVMKVDPSDPSVLYFLWSEDPGADVGDDDSDTMFKRCDFDTGTSTLTCNPAKRINDDINPAGDFHSQFFPWMAVDPTDGSVNIVWYDDRDDPDRTDGQPLVDLYFASSSDGGLSFSQNLRVSENSSDTSVNFNPPFFGDYNGIDALDGVAYPIWTNNDPNPTSDQDVFVTQIGGADLSITKTAAESVIAGEELIYDITVDNAGPGAAFNVTVTDTLPPQATFIDDTDSCTEGPPGVLTCDLGNIAAGDSVTFQVRVSVTAGSGVDTLVNEAEVVSDQDDPDDTNNVDTASTFILESADLAVTKDCKPDQPAMAGETATCTIFVTNLGISAARDVTLTDTHFSDVLFDVVGFSGATCVENPGGPAQSIEVSCSLGDLAVDQTVIVTVPTPDPDTSNNQATDMLTFLGEADLAITKSDSPDPVTAGLQLTYTLTVTNNGPSDAVNVVVTDNVPAGVSLDSVGVTLGVGACNAGVPGDPAQPTVCTFDSLANGGSAQMQIVATVLPQTTGLLHNDARVAGDTPDSNNANDLATETTTVQSVANLVVSKSDAPDPVLAGEQLTYTVTVLNNGPSTARMVDLVDTLPAGVSLIGASILEGGGTCSETGPGVLTCTLGDLDPGFMFTVVIDVLVAASVPDGTTLTNTAEVFEEGVLETSITEDTTVQAAADLWIDKTGNFPTGNPSGTILYFLTVHNAEGCSSDDPQVCGAGGPSDAQNVTVVDPLPSTAKKLPVEFVSEQCSYSAGSHTVTCTEPVLAAGDSVTFAIQVRAKGSLGDLFNTATVSSTTTDPNGGNNSDTLLMTVKGGTGDSGGPGGGRGRGNGNGPK